MILNTIHMSLESEAGFKALFEYATIGILVIHANGEIALANPCVENMFEYDKGELQGKPLEMLMPQAFRNLHAKYRERFFDTPRARPMGYGLDLFAIKKSGEEFPVEISLGHYKLGENMLAVAFITDITERKKYHQELEEKVRERTLELTDMLEREKELNEIKSRFVSMASHEFRTPLSTILSSTSLIENYSKIEDEEKRKKHIERVKSSVKNLTDILNNFLSLDKLEQGKVEIQFETFDVEEFITDILEDIRGLLKPSQKVIVTHEGLFKTSQDKKILRNVLLNLLSNASKYSDENGVIELCTNVSDKHVVISVKDNGIGIPEADQKNLFGKFFRAQNAENIQGTGLGLNIVSRYMEILKGHITFESTPERGTTFTITYPHRINL